MLIFRLVLLVIPLVIVGCSSSPEPSVDSSRTQSSASYYAYADYIRPASAKYGIDERLIRSIIAVESSFNPNAVSKSNAIGLMQIKSDTSGKDVFRLLGRSGKPSKRELMDPAQNINIGTAYLSILKNQHLAGIKNPKVMHYAMIVSYANGAGALLRTFSADRQTAIKKINKMTPEAFYQHVKTKHPAPQAPRYLHKVTAVYTASR